MATQLPAVVVDTGTGYVCQCDFCLLGYKSSLLCGLTDQKGCVKSQISGHKPKCL